MRRRLRPSDYLAGYALLSLIGYGITWICWQAAGGAGLVALALFVLAGCVARLSMQKPRRVKAGRGRRALPGVPKPRRYSIVVQEADLT